MSLKETKLIRVRATDAKQGVITALEGQLVSLKHNYGELRDVVVQAFLPGQHQVTEGDLQVGLGILDLVQVEPKCLLTAMEEDLSQRGTLKMAMV